MRKLTLLIALLSFLPILGQGYKVYLSDGKVDAYPDETAVSVSLNDDSLRYNGHEYVDLGLPSGTRWARTNVGAEKSYANGLRFAFSQADIETLWGGDWHLPAVSQYQELINACHWEWTKIANSQGYTVTGPNGNTLFLPAAGFIDPARSYTAGLPGLTAGYWTQEGYSFAFTNDHKGIDSRTPALQLSLRPVIGGIAPQDARSELLQEDTHEYVDLGLSVLWATKNIGAEYPSDRGDYFSPGITEPKPTTPNSDSYEANLDLNDWLKSRTPFYGYSLYNYMFFYREDVYQEWIQQEMPQGYIDRVRTLGECGYWILPEHDAAAVLWGNGWRMPTLSEFKELVENTRQRRDSYSTTVFYDSNGNELYMPLAGYYQNDSWSSGGEYLTSSIGDYLYSFSVDWRSLSFGRVLNYIYFYPIRPVKDRPKNGLTDEETTAKQEMVDLGLSVLWANCNLGATNPEDKGEYIAWGESFPKAIYTKDNHTAGKLTTDSWIATQPMFGKAGWTLPSASDVKELMDKCTWVREADGYRVAGPNGNSIFLPYTGFREGASFCFPNEVGFYWTSDSATLSMRLDDKYALTPANGYLGMAVRPVMPVSHPETGDAQTDWHSATIVCRAKGTAYREFGIQLCYVKNMDNKAAGTWNVPADSASLQDGKYTVLAFLQPATPYYYRAYAVTENGSTLYGDIKQLHTTADIPAVDLGLSVKWAPVNLGGRTDFDTTDWYRHPSCAYNYTPGQLSEIFSEEGSYSLAPHTSWPEEWRMPTDAEFQELLTACTWEWQEGGCDLESYPDNPENRNGYKVTGPNGNSIFLQANGMIDDEVGKPSQMAAVGYYWTQTATDGHDGLCNILKFTATDRKLSYGWTGYRYSIRPVKK